VEHRVSFLCPLSPFNSGVAVAYYGLIPAVQELKLSSDSLPKSVNLSASLL
jgi:hypothetical protein